MGHYEFDGTIETGVTNKEAFEKLLRKTVQESCGYVHIDMCFRSINNAEEYYGIYKAFESNFSVWDYPYRDDYSNDEEGEKEYQEDLEKYEAALKDNPYCEDYSSGDVLYIYNEGRPYIKCSTECTEIAQSGRLPFNFDKAKSLFKANKGQKYMIIKALDRNFQHAIMGDGKLKECTDFCKKCILDGTGTRYYVINKSLSKYWTIEGSVRSKNKSRYHIFGHYHH